MPERNNWTGFIIVLLGSAPSRCHGRRLTGRQVRAKLALKSEAPRIEARRLLVTPNMRLRPKP